MLLQDSTFPHYSMIRKNTVDTVTPTNRKYKRPFVPPPRQHSPQRPSPAAIPRAQGSVAAPPERPGARHSAAPRGLAMHRRMGEGRAQGCPEAKASGRTVWKAEGIDFKRDFKRSEV